MASKSKRSTRARESVVHVDSSVDESSSFNGSTRPQSPNNTHIFSRQDEKKQLSMLNDRLATYIDTVRRLESENNQLQVQIREIETVERREKEKIEHLYEGKIEDLRKHNEALTRDKAKLQVDIDKARSERDEYKLQAGKLEKEFKKCDAERKKLQSEYQDITALYNKADSARRDAERENEDLKREVGKYGTQLDVAHRQLEDEVVLRTELENRLRAMKEDLEFAKMSHHNQMEEFRQKRHYEMTTFSKEIENEYQNKLQEKLQNLRADADNRLAQNRAEMEALYAKKLAEAVENVNRNRESASKAVQESAVLRARVRELEASSVESKQTIDHLTRKLNELESRLQMLREENDARIKQRDEQIGQLQDEIANMIKDYQNLLDVKVQLDTELQAYHNLLESEETRLRITPTQSPNTSQNVSSSDLHVSFADSMGGQLVSTSPSARRGTKRRRVTEDYHSFDQFAKSYKTSGSAEGDIVIEDADPEGQYVKLHNKGVTDISIATWTVKYIGAEREVSYKFNTRQALKAGRDVTIWSNNLGKEHHAPSNLVMRNQAWPAADVSRVELINSEGRLVAWRESVLQNSGSVHEAGTNPDERCSIM